ncbi:sensor histidine kinase [Bacillus sp. B-jedd]|uniref:sensor histidine kinase n=1 Tax=Bacillus sp. B-jedd TaxID=1476857 RepID=UPI0005155AC4|nr:histidine kinase [Bacillus sp. B-jedd]CEG29141.1 two-component sensor histidine kinase [Bacillus sp. B-jedd]
MKGKKRNFKEATKSLFLQYTVIPISILIVLFFFFTIIIFKLILVHEANQAAGKIDKEISLVSKNYTEELKKITEHPAVMEYLEFHAQSNLVYEEFYSFNNKQKVRSIFHLADENGDVLLTSANLTSKAVNENIRSVIHRMAKNPKEILIDAGKNQYSHGKVTVLTMGKAIVKNNKVIGYSILQLYEEDFLNLIFAENADISVITDSYDTIIVSTNSVVKGLINKFRPQYSNNSDSYVDIKDATFFISEKSTDPNFKVYVLKTTKTHNAFILIYLVFIVIVSCVLYYLVKHLAEKMSSKNAHSIEKLLAAVSRLQTGDKNAYVEINSGDEFEVLANKFNTMLDNLNHLDTKNKELAEIQRKSEIKFLQSQFNPHFLFNVLETLRYTLLLNTNMAQEIIITLSKLLRYSINNGVPNVKLDKDLNYIEDYLKLHKMRFNDRLEYEILVPDEIRNTVIPKLLLQPVIENSIKYGFRNHSHLTIGIKGEIISDKIVLTVSDNGGGITEEQLKRINGWLSNPDSTLEHFGLYNVHRKLVLLFGEDYGLTINSEYGHGTTVEIMLPLHKGEWSHV